ncbi:MAG: ATPase, T2SS/T4P/T4SS family [Patescibacteria group bacterium]|jgi:type IV pilus assembly protein PilB
MDKKAAYQNYYPVTEDILATQSILDVFVLQNILDPEDADKLKAKLKTNREVEDFLLRNRIVSRDTINKAYSIIFKLPYIELKNVEISEELRKAVPEKLVRKYGIIPFGITEGILRLAMYLPADLLVNYQTGLIQLFADRDLKIELYITGQSDFNECLKQYQGKANQLLIKKGSLPVVFLRNQNISQKFLTKIPLEFIQKYRIAVFGQNANNYFLVACEQPDSPVVIRILEFIEKENNIKVERFATSREDIDYIIGLLDKKAQPAKTADNSKEAETKTAAISSNPKIKDKDSLASMLDNFLGSNDPKLTVDEIPNADLVSRPDPAEKPKVGRDAIAEMTAVSATPSSDTTTTQNNTSETDQAKKADATAEQIAPSNEIKAPEGAGGEFTVTAEAKKQKVAADNSEAEGAEKSSLDSNDIGALIREEVKTLAQLESIAKEGFIPKIVAAVIDFALNQRSSDIHVEPNVKDMRIRCRIDGILTDVLKMPPKMQPPFVSRIKIMSRLKIDETRVPQDGRFDVKFMDHEVDVRVSTLPTVHGEKIVMRVLDKSKSMLSLEDLGVTGSASEKTIDAMKKPYGIILVTGPTGSGKSTTLYAILSRLSVPGVNIVTLEDPVEYEIPGINQCQVKPEIGFTFASGLRSILRQDPNIIMVGEIRDAETASMATHAALTGHLVLSTLHTNDTAGALPRLINMGVEPFLITSSINLVVAQRLVRRICPKCKEEMKIPPKLMDELKAEVAKIPQSNQKDFARIPADPKVFYGKGCSDCNHGYKGRIGIFEVMSITPSIEELAVTKRPANEIKEVSIKEGMITMKQDGILKAFEGQTTIDEVFQAVINS